MNDFTQKISEALTNKQNELDNIELPQMQKHYRLQATAIRGVLDILLRKRLVHNDPYKYDSRMAEIELPSVDAFAESERASVIGTRLSHYEMMLEFLNTNYQFNCDFLNPHRLGLLDSLNKVFIWDDFSTNSPSPNTAALALILESVFTSSDSLSVNLLRDSIGQIGKAHREIQKILNETSTFHKEKYKLNIRSKILPELPEQSSYNPDAILQNIKKIFAARFKKRPFYKQLVLEVINETYSSNAGDLQLKVLQNLSVKDDSDDEANVEVELRPIILAGLKTLANSGAQFSLALEKIEANMALIEKEDRTFFSALAELFRKAFNIKKRQKDIVIIVTDPITQSKKKQNINFQTFRSDMIRKINIFQNLVNSASPVHQKIKQIPDAELFENLNQYVKDCNELLVEMAGLDQYYKTVKPELRNKIKGIKLEITTIKNSVMNANQYRAEYNSVVEEQAQLKRLGIV